MAELLNRPQIKAQVKEQLRTAQVSPKGMVALYMSLILLLNVLVYLCGGAGLPSMFLTTLAHLLSIVLEGGFALYCMAIHQNERVEYPDLFNGFSFAGKLILLTMAQTALVFLGSMLFVIPGIIAFYRYRFSLYNLCENPELPVTQALQMSVRQTRGYKMQLFNLDVSFLGWTVLSMLPVFVMETYTFAASMDLAVYLSTPSTLISIVLQGLWSMIVSMFYYPNYICCDLAYFDAAKATSRSDASPDGLGGF